MAQRITNQTVHNPQMLRKVLEALDTEVDALRTAVNEVRTTSLGTILDGSKTWNPGSLADGAGETTNLTVSGAALGDFVLVAPPVSVSSCLVTGYVSATDTVTIRLQNESGATYDMASGTWRVKVFPYTALASLRAAEGVEMVAHGA